MSSFLIKMSHFKPICKDISLGTPVTLCYKLAPQKLYMKGKVCFYMIFAC